MAQLKVQVDGDHLKQLVRGPKTGLAELIWNALDADATTVRVNFRTSTLGAISQVEVVDDGEGMADEEIRQGFGALGGSWKRDAKVTRGEGRQLHGKQGKGDFPHSALESPSSGPRYQVATEVELSIKFLASEASSTASIFRKEYRQISKPEPW